MQVFSTHLTTCLWTECLQPTKVEWLRRRLLKWNKSWPQGLLNLDAWVVPRHRGRHWTGAVIHFRAKCIVFADSMGSSDDTFCRRLWCLLEVASLVFKQSSFDLAGWTWGSLSELAPRQPTPYDCGIFASVLLVSARRLWGHREYAGESNLARKYNAAYNKHGCASHHRRDRSCTESSCERRPAGRWPTWMHSVGQWCWSCFEGRSSACVGEAGDGGVSLGSLRDSTACCLQTCQVAGGALLCDDVLSVLQ